MCMHVCAHTQTYTTKIKKKSPDRFVVVVVVTWMATNPEFSRSASAIT